MQKEQTTCAKVSRREELGTWRNWGNSSVVTEQQAREMVCIWKKRAIPYRKSRRTPYSLALIRGRFTDRKKTMGEKRDRRKQEFILFPLNLS